ncbi:hypothetical protein CRUP_003376 [Coryphaenoides rupestris]|nr:hypothetical protein CRUP_003376 [Coryphaenoides rupestris]
MELREDMMEILEKVWTKLQGLPEANALELGAFFILILFISTFLFMIVLCCVHCCCCGKPKYQGARVQPVQPI